jgi:ATP-binding cassette subfamily C (CFTR/MRP) protein 1
MAGVSKACSIAADDQFGPQVDTCLRKFDFTLLFEETILTILPMAIVLFATACRVVVLSMRGRKTQLDILSALKLVRASFSEYNGILTMKAVSHRV